MIHAKRARLAALLAATTLAAGCSTAADIAGSEEPSTGVASSSETPTEPTDSTPPEPTDSTPPETEPGESGLPEGFHAGPDGRGIDRFYDQKVAWTACEGGECTDIWVPLDYSKPDGDAITVKAKRDPADDQANRLGSMFINPGGPGGSGIDYLQYASFDASVTDVYDVIGFDPRGVASSTPVECLSDEEVDVYLASEPTPDDADELREFEKVWAAYTSDCVEHSGPLLEHVSTVEVARDLDIMREVVKDDALTYFGASYGTYIGATYAGLFPDEVGRMVLDGAVDPSADPRESAIKQAVGFETALSAYLEYCVDKGDCPLGDDVGAARDRLSQLFRDIDAQPLPTTDGRELTEGLAFIGVITPLYSRDNWDYETQALRQAIEGEGDILLLLADAYAERQPDGSYPNNSTGGAVSGQLPRPPPRRVAEGDQGRQPRLHPSRPRASGSAAQWWPYACSNWPVQPTAEQPGLHCQGSSADPGGWYDAGPGDAVRASRHTR
ncbi:MAG: alpha/beta fold hydrolase [Nocardioidaceae bacterium]